MKRTKMARTESKCAACNGSGFSAVKQPAQPGRRIYPPRCVKCDGSGKKGSGKNASGRTMKATR